MEGGAEPEYCITDAGHLLLTGNVPQKNKLPCRFIPVFRIDGRSHDHVQNPAVLCQPPGFMTEYDLFFEKFLYCLTGFLFKPRRCVRNGLTFQFIEGPAEYFGEGGVQVVHPPIQGEYDDRVWNEVEEGSQTSFRLAQGQFRLFLFGNILKGLYGAGDVSRGISQWRCSKEEPFAPCSQVAKLSLGLIAALHKGGFLIPALVISGDFLFRGIVHDKVGHGRTFCGIKGRPLVPGADDFMGRDACQVLIGLVDMGNDMVIVDDKCGDRGFVKDLGKPFSLGNCFF